MADVLLLTPQSMAFVSCSGVPGLQAYPKSTKAAERAHRSRLNKVHDEAVRRISAGDDTPSLQLQARASQQRWQQQTVQRLKGAVVGPAVPHAFAVAGAAAAQQHAPLPAASFSESSSTNGSSSSSSSFGNSASSWGAAASPTAAAQQAPLLRPQQPSTAGDGAGLYAAAHTPPAARQAAAAAPPPAEQQQQAVGGGGEAAEVSEEAIAAAFRNEPPPDVHVVNTLAAAQAAARQLMSMPDGSVFACDTEVMDIDVRWVGWGGWVAALAGRVARWATGWEGGGPGVEWRWQSLAGCSGCAASPAPPLPLPAAAPLHPPPRSSHSPCCHGKVICFSIYAGPDMHWGEELPAVGAPRRSMLWVDTWLDGEERRAGEARAIVEAFRPFWESQQHKKVGVPRCGAAAAAGAGGWCWCSGCGSGACWACVWSRARVPRACLTALQPPLHPSPSHACPPRPARPPAPCPLPPCPPGVAQLLL